MSTNSIIGIKKLDGTETKIYCHWDGYIEHNGLILQMYYDTPEKIEELLELGNLSSLDRKIKPEGHHTFERPESGVCVAYHRDRGEELEDATGYDDQEYNYIFDERIGAWLVDDYRFVTIECESIPSEYTFDKKNTRYLIDMLVNSEKTIREMWEDDEIATKETVIDVLIEKARTQIMKANARKADEDDFWYRLYCD